jgi:hypothetical protein
MAMPWEHMTTSDFVARDKGELPQASLGASVPSASPGAELGTSYYDYQSNNYQGRMIRVGTHTDAGDEITFVHSAWMDLTGPDLSNGRGPAYAYYDAFAGVYQTEVNVTFSPEFAGYHNLEITENNTAVICGHYHPTGNTDLYSPTLWYDPAPGLGSFDCKAIVPDALQAIGNPYSGGDARMVWPHVSMHFKPDGTEVAHLTALAFAGGSARHVAHYYRKEVAPAATDCNDGSTGCLSPADPTWECPWVFDTLQATTAGIEASDISGNVALFWNANLPDYVSDPGCDTCSDNDDLGGLRNRFENDIYYQVSNDYGENWNNRVNVTKMNTETADWMPWSDIDGLWTGTARAEEFHIAWVASDWKAWREEGILYYRARIYHWAESFGTGPDAPRAAMQSRQDPIDCNAGAFNMNLSKINLATCNGNIYITAVDLWDGHHDPGNPDCSERGVDGDFDASVNGDVVVVISDNNGLSFDLPHNLTNSPTPGCDPAGAVLVCDADHWPSMTPYGHPTDVANENWGLVTSINPRPAQLYDDGAGVEWLHIQYVNDKDPGFVINDNSTWQDNPIKHFRMACVDPDQIPVFNLNITEVNWPTFVKPESTKNVNVVMENTGNAPLNFTVQDFEDTGPSGWLSVSGLASPLQDGTNNKDTGLFVLNADGLVSGNVVLGSVLFDSDAPTDTDRVPVVMIVGDTIRGLNWDTISTGVLSLAISNTGQFSGGGNAGTRGVRMDYFNDPAECDTVDSIPGDTRVYLYDGGFAVGGAVDTDGVGGVDDTVFANQIFGQGFRNEWSVYPLGDATVIDTAQIYYWKSPKMVNEDTTLGFRVAWYAPQVTQSYFSGANTRWMEQQFVTRSLKVWSNSSTDSAKGLAVGDALDWDIPADSGSDNDGVGDAGRRLLYQIGGEYDQDNTLECQDNDLRFGGVALGWTAHWKSTGGPKRWFADSAGWGGYVEANNRYVYQGWDAAELYVNMETNNAWVGWTGPTPDSQQTDLHSVLTAAFDFDLAPGETLAVYTVYASVRNDAASRIEQLADRGRAFTKYWGCCEGRAGDYNGDGNDANVLDMNIGINIFFRLTLPVSAVPCLGEADVNRNGLFNSGDVTVLINRVFRQNDQVKHCSEGA